jgi:hypothetical protein
MLCPVRRDVQAAAFGRHALESRLCLGRAGRSRVEPMASEDEIRSYVEWYVAALRAAAQAIDDGDDAAQIIRDRVDELSEAEARNVLQVMISHYAQQPVQVRRRRWNPLRGRGRGRA